MVNEEKDLQTHSVLNTDFSRPMFWGYIAFTLLFGGIFTWFAFAPLASAVIAPGSVIVKGRPQLIQHLDGGIIREIFVHNGDVVKKDDTLVRLDDVLLLANLEIYRNRLRDASAKKARLETERDDKNSITFDNENYQSFFIGDETSARQRQQELFETRRISQSGQMAQLDEKIFQLNNQINGVEGLLKARNEQLHLIDKELKGLKYLQEKGIASLNRVLAVEREKVELIGQIAEYQAERARIENTISETKITKLQVRRQFQESVLTELQETSNQVYDLVQQILATTKQLERIDIKAPINGIVHELSINTVGGVIPPGGTVLQLVPIEEGVELEVNVEPQSIDELYVGQSAVIRFSAFNQRTTPELKGKVHIISPSSITDERTGVSFYRVIIDTPQSELEKLGGLKVIPGMPVEVHIQTQEQTPLTYLLKPFLDQFRRAMRET